MRLVEAAGRSGGGTHLFVLGPVELHVDSVSVPLSDLERGLLALAAFRGQVGGDDLADWLWGEDLPGSARNRIQALVSSVRRKAGPAPLLVTEGAAYRLSDAVRVDHDSWLACVARARALRVTEPATSIAGYDDALQLFAGQPLRGAPRTPRADIERDRLDQERLLVVEERMATKLDSGRLDGVVSEVAAMAAQHPFHEGFVALNMLALAASGRQRQALDIYQAARARLDDELGIEPSAQLRDAHQRVLSGEVSTNRAPASEVIAAEPVSGEPRGGDLRTAASAALPVPQTLPRPPTHFVGRLPEIDRLDRGAEQALHRAVVASITGLTGVGKSALAAEAGARLRRSFPDGSLYADLSGTHGGGIHAELGNFLRLLGVLPEAIPDDLRALSGLFRSLIDGKRVLIVLDNVDSADGAVDPLMAHLLPASPGSMAIVTSRAPIDSVDPTFRIRLQALPHDDAVRLLEDVAGAERIEAEIDAVRDLVHHTGALPLALRLVGSRLTQRPDLTVRALVHRLADIAHGLGALDEATAKESSLRASLTMVWNRLPEETCRVAHLLTLLPVDTFGAWVPQALLGDARAGERAMNSLVDAAFVEPVLVRGRLPQYRLHDLVARFAQEQLATADDSRVRAVTDVGNALLDRVARHHANFPLQFMPLPSGMPSPSPAATAEDAGTDDAEDAHALLLTELAAARGCARVLAEHEPGLAWRLIAAYENVHQLAVDEQAWSGVVDAVLSRLDPVRDDDRLGAATLTLCRAWHLQDKLGQYRSALGLAQQARRDLTLLGALPYAMAAGLVAANAAVALSDRKTAEAELGRMADRRLGAEEAVLVGWRHIVLGELYNDYDELSECEQELTRARAVLAETGELIGYAYATSYLSRALWRQGKLGPAQVLADEALADFGRLGAEHAYTVALDARAEVAVALGHGDEALEQAGTALSRAVAAHDAFIRARATRTRARALRVLGSLDEAARELTSSIEQFAALNRTLSLAATLHDLALVQDMLGEPAAASESLRQERSALLRAHHDKTEARRRASARR